MTPSNLGALLMLESPIKLACHAAVWKLSGSTKTYEEFAVDCMTGAAQSQERANARRDGIPF